ncbi:DUF3800 domain-containing protein [Patescibacteria group bacterium]|nr:DUF3800 domain-containing protein [Patescibacteria group bacterium]
MNIYLDESYNLQREKGKQFISINGFAVLNDKILRKSWKKIRKEYLSRKKRIHATDSHFEPLRKPSIKLICRHDVSALSVFQIIQQISNKDYFTTNKIQFEKIYLELLKKLLAELSLREYQLVRIIIDKRKHKGGKLGSKEFKEDIEKFLKKNYPKTNCIFKHTPSNTDTLLELADFVSNTFYKEYQKGSKDIFKELGLKLIQIKNPL